MFTTRFLLPALLVATLAVPACDLKKKAKASEKSAKASAETTATESATAEASGEAAGVVSSGNTKTFKFISNPTKEEQYKPYEVLFKKGSRLDDVVDAMGVYKLPRDVGIVAATECDGVPNAYYSPKTHGIKICYPIADNFYKNFMGKLNDDGAASQKTLDALTFVMLHEMGHALVAELELGVTGGEEDAVDELAALILIQNKRADWAIAGTEALIELNKSLGQTKPKYFDEHSISEQRFYNILCMIYGSDPKANGKIIEDYPELKKRSGKCPNEYSVKDRAWTKMLQPHTGKKG